MRTQRSTTRKHTRWLAWLVTAAAACGPAGEEDTASTKAARLSCPTPRWKISLVSKSAYMPASTP